MALKKCRECNNEVSDKAEVCPNCGIKNPIGKTSKKKYIIVSVIIFLYFISVLISIQQNEQEEIKQQQIKEQKEHEKQIAKEKAHEKKITNTIEIIKNTDKKEVSTLFDAYKFLNESYPTNLEYQKGFKKYDDLINMKYDCVGKAGVLNKNLLQFKATYDKDFFDDYLKGEWKDDKIFIYQSSFYGNNAFNVKQQFITQYKCTIKKDGNFSIELIKFQEL